MTLDIGPISVIATFTVSVQFLEIQFGEASGQLPTAAGDRLDYSTVNFLYKNSPYNNIHYIRIWMEAPAVFVSAKPRSLQVLYKSTGSRPYHILTVRVYHTHNPPAMSVILF